MAAPKTVKTVTLDGSTKDFEIPFEYLARKFVVLTLIGVDRKELVLNVDYRFTQRTIVTTTQVWGPGTGYTLLEIKRVTSATERLVDFSDGSILRASDLNTATVQALHIAEEGRDIATDTIGVDNAGNLDARGRRIVNLADAINPGDAVTLKQNQEWGGSALNQANRATAQADIATTQANAATQRAAAALVSQNAAEVSEANAKTSEANAKTSETNAKTSETNALVSRSAALASRNAAADSASASASSAATSKAEADRAKTEADKLGNFNGLAGALDNVSGVDVTWKGQQIATGKYQVRGDGDVTYQFSNLDGSNSIRWTRNAGGAMLLVDDRLSKIRINSDTIGNLSIPATMTANGNLRANGGVIGVRARLDTDNAGLWFYGTGDTTRSTIYSDNAGSLILFPAYGMGGQPVTIAPNGQLNTLMGLALDASSNVRLTNTGNIVSPIYPGGNLATALTALNTGVRRMTSTKLFSGTAGNGSLVVLSDDAFNYESFNVNVGSPAGVLMSLTGLRELANLPLLTKFNINLGLTSSVSMWFEDSDTNQRRRLRMGTFTSSGFSNMYGMTSYSY